MEQSARAEIGTGAFSKMQADDEGADRCTVSVAVLVAKVLVFIKIEFVQRDNRFLSLS